MDLPRRAESLRTLRFALLAALALVGPTAAADDKPGDFDYWVLALSWAPQYCKSEPGDEQCTRADGFVVHGLWPQNERGYPDYCGPRERVPEALVDRMLPLMPSKNLIQHQWRKHGNCSGMATNGLRICLDRDFQPRACGPDVEDLCRSGSTSGRCAT